MRMIKADCIALQSMLYGDDDVGCGMGIAYSCCKRRGRLLEKATATSRMDYSGGISAGEQREGLFSHSSNIGGAGDYHSKFDSLSFVDGDKRLVMHDWPKFGIWELGFCVAF